jgi:hypothetical protein
MNGYKRIEELRDHLQILDDTLNKKKHNYQFTKYKLFMYRYYKQFLEHEFNQFTYAMEKYYKGISSKPQDTVECYSYDDFLKKVSKRYVFLSKIKKNLNEHYENRIEELYKKTFHPKIIAAMLDEGYDIEDAFDKLDESLKYVRL